MVVAGVDGVDAVEGAGGIGDGGFHSGIGVRGGGLAVCLGGMVRVQWLRMAEAT